MHLVHPTHRRRKIGRQMYPYCLLQQDPAEHLVIIVGIRHGLLRPIRDAFPLHPIRRKLQLLPMRRRLVRVTDMLTILPLTTSIADRATDIVAMLQ